MHSLFRSGAKLHTCRQLMFKKCSSVSNAKSNRATSEKLSYAAFIEGRQEQATRSIVVQVNSEKSFAELYNYCNAYGSIVSAHHYRVQQDDDMHYILLEFNSTHEASAAIEAASYNEELSSVPARSPFLWFRAPSKQQLKVAKSAKIMATSSTLNVLNGTHALDNIELNSLLQGVPNVEQQIQTLYKHTQLNDLGVRLRFLAAFQLQQALSGIFPAAKAQPFGSSVNGFGKMGCDLDLILRFDREVVESNPKERYSSRLVFHTKENLSNGRSQTQRQMETIGDMLQLFLPGVCHVRRILQARVPIIKYHHEHLNLEVDLSMSNLTGYYMSELLYMFGECDARVRPLVFCIRRWASSCGLTNPSPGRWISNFSLTCLVIFFLQQLKQPILPSIGALSKAAMPSDLRMTEDGINCTFTHDFDRVGFRSRNTSSVSDLLLQFFEFYSQFDFHNRGVSLNEARGISKPDHSAIYIVNPLEQALNVSKNISLEECERLRIEVRNAAWILESEVESPSLTESEKRESAWGLLNLFKTADKAVVRPNMFFKPRMVDVSELFEKSQGPEMPETPIVYKNESVKHQVQSVKAQVRANLNQMRLQATTNTPTTTTNATSKTKSRRRSS